MKMFEKLGVVATVITLVSFSISLINASSYEKMASYSSTLRVCDPDYDSWVDFIEFLRANNGRIVLLYVDFQFDRDVCNTNFINRSATSDTISEGSMFFLSPRVLQKATALSSSSLDHIVKILPDNGTAIEFIKSDVVLNSFSEMQLYVEGLEDRFRGPFQIKLEAEDAFYHYKITYPIISDDERKSMECSIKQWSLLERAIRCPFL